MTITTAERVSPFTSEFNWDDYTSYLYHQSDDSGFLTVEQMVEELKVFQMDEFSNGITFSWHVEDFVNYIYDANS